MTVLVDTSVWSLGLRRRSGPRTTIEARAAREWSELVREGRAALIGPIRQEILSGIRDRDAYEKLRLAMRAFPDLPLVEEDYEAAAELANACRRRGIAAGPTDVLVAAAARRRTLRVFTTDDDFRRLRRLLAFELHQAR